MELDLLNLLLVLLAAWGGGLLARRLGYPAVLGELLAGIVFGPPVLGVLHGGAALGVLGQVGLLLMMLYVGMEIDPAELGRASKGGLLAAVGGFAAPFALGYAAMVLVGEPPLAAVFVGVAAGVTSLAANSRILVDLQLLDTRIAHVMMAAALVTDTLALGVLGAVFGLAEAGRVDGWFVGVVALKAAVFFVGAAVVGLRVLPPLMRAVERGAPGRTATFTALLLVALAYAEAAEAAGLHAILGAFLAGLFLREGVLGRTLSRQLIELVRDTSLGFLAPVFFVLAGFSVTLGVFASSPGLLLALIGLATLGKVAGTALAYLPTGHGWREGVVVGVGSNGRGAVEVVVAQVGLALGLISPEVFSILVVLAMGTTALVPLTLKAGVAWLKRHGGLARAAHERRGTLVAGAGPTARALAHALADGGEPVRLLDVNAAHVAAARAEGLDAQQGSALDERALAERGAAEAARLVALTPNAEVNALAALTARTEFAVPELFLLDAGAGEEADALRGRLDAAAPFGGPADLAQWDLRLGSGQAAVERRLITAAEDAARLAEGGELPLTVRRDGETLPVRAGEALQPGDELVTIVAGLPVLDAFDRLVAEAPVLDLPPDLEDRPLSMGSFVKAVARALSPRVGVPEGRLMERLTAREATSTTVILPGLAIPHVRLAGRGLFMLALVRARTGVVFPDADAPVVAAFVLVASPDEQTRHLRTLSAIAQVVQAPAFERRWRDAPDADALRKLVLEAPRRRS